MFGLGKHGWARALSILEALCGSSHLWLQAQDFLPFIVHCCSYHWLLDLEENNLDIILCPFYDIDSAYPIIRKLILQDYRVQVSKPIQVVSLAESHCGSWYRLMCFNGMSKLSESVFVGFAQGYDWATKVGQF